MTPVTQVKLEGQYREMLRQIAEPLMAYTGGQKNLSEAPVRVLDREGWVLTNIPGIRRLLAPIEEAYGDRVEPDAQLPLVPFFPADALARTALSGELGFLLGYLSRHVLGQYDIALLTGGVAEPGALYFVEPNIQATQLRLGLPGREFRLWLTLHEATHAFEFEDTPWVREYLDASLAAYLTTLVEQITDGQNLLSPGLGSLLRSVRSGDSLIEAVMSEEQRVLFWRLQALMTVLEGYATHVMNAVGQQMLTHYREISDRVEGRWQQRSSIQNWILRLTGLELKLEQYRLGDAFFDYIDRERGGDFARRIWEGPNNLPTYPELREPATWLARIQRSDLGMHSGGVHE
jgi:coenzyme F420 biosynthesis associated uncharacterized protein